MLVHLFMHSLWHATTVSQPTSVLYGMHHNLLYQKSGNNDQNVQLHYSHHSCQGVEQFTWWRHSHGTASIVNHEGHKQMPGLMMGYIVRSVEALKHLFQDASRQERSYTAQKTTNGTPAKWQTMPNYRTVILQYPLLSAKEAGQMWCMALGLLNYISQNRMHSVQTVAITVTWINYGQHG